MTPDPFNLRPVCTGVSWARPGHCPAIQALSSAPHLIACRGEGRGLSGPSIRGQKTTDQEPKGQEPKGQESKGQEPKGQEPKGQEPKGQVPEGQSGDWDYVQTFTPKGGLERICKI